MFSFQKEEGEGQKVIPSLSHSPSLRELSWKPEISTAAYILLPTPIYEEKWTYSYEHF